MKPSLMLLDTPVLQECLAPVAVFIQNIDIQQTWICVYAERKQFASGNDELIHKIYEPWHLLYV